MASYSLDLRKRIVDAVERGVGSKRKIAKLFGVHESFIYKLLRQKRARGDIAPLPHGGGASAKLTESDLLTLTDLVAETPDATLEELCAQLKKRAGVEVSPSTICRGLQALELTVKKKTRLAAEADPVERAAFRATQKTLPLERLIFIDEFASNIAMTRTRARSPKGFRAEVVEPTGRGQNVSTIAAMGLRGVCAPMMIEGAINTEVFDLYVAQLLVPVLRGGDIVLLDNVKFHYSERAISLIEAAGARVLHTPTYSPDFNPIEECISKIKETLRSLKARTKRRLYNALAKAIEKVTADDILGWFKHCGYAFSLN
ncbi:MAG: IS630 family transposase [Pyrinomonadaceae bacterium]